MHSVGIKEDFQNLDKVLKSLVFKFICIDVANGYTEHFTNFIKSVRDKYPTKTIIAGNVVTADMTQELVRGADIGKLELDLSVAQQGFRLVLVINWRSNRMC